MATPVSQSQLDSQTFRDAMASLAAPLAVVTTRDQAGRCWGFTASSVMSASLDPPLLVVGLSHTSSCHTALCAASEFVVNVLGDGHAGVARRFATRGVERFEGSSFVDLSNTRLPALPDAVAVVRCRLREVVTVGDHDLLVAEPSAVRLDQHPPLVWYRRNFHRIEAI